MKGSVSLELSRSETLVFVIVAVTRFLQVAVGYEMRTAVLMQT